MTTALAPLPAKSVQTQSLYQIAWRQFKRHSLARWGMLILALLFLSALFAVNMAVTLLVMGVGLVALWSGIRRKYPPGCAFLGHSRFSNYVMILIFPIQSKYIEWSWARLAAIFIFALPVWVLVNLGMFFLRRPKPGRRR